MLRTRQRRLAWMFVLALALELALLCYASIHLTDHVCCGHRDCAICAFVRTGLRRAAAVALAVAALLALAAVQTGVHISRRATVGDSLVLRRVRLND